jgi:hypothetical protein
MKGQRDNPSARSAGSRTGKRTPSSETIASQKEEADETLIEVQCPNPECGKIYRIQSSYAGKTGECKCGTVFSIPAPGQERTQVERPPAEEGDLPEGEAMTEVRVGCIGRGHAGKTALLAALAEGPVGDFFPSGLHVDAGDPRGVAQMLRESEEAQRMLRQFGLPPTLKASQIHYYLYEGAVQRVVCKMREVIGQVLTHTLPDSAPEQQARYRDYLKSLVNTQVLWAVVPCPPPNPSARDRRRYANDLRITLAYLREALRLGSPKQRTAVALVLSKIDTLFKDAEDARASLTDDVLRTSFGPLVSLIEQSPRVADAVIIPVTAFGFGNAVLREEGSGQQGGRPDAEDGPFGAEPTWLLREGASPEPYNLDTLVVWTLLFGLLNQAGHGVIEEDTELGQICRTLAHDLEAIDPWVLSVKGGEVGPLIVTGAGSV